LGTYLLRELAERGVQTSFLHVHRVLRNPEGLSRLLHSCEQANLIVLSCPLYVDSLPAPVIRVMEAIAEQREGLRLAEKRFTVIVNCGFPEARHTEIALAICRRFARETGLRWEGGLGLGGGEAIAGRPLNHVGGLARNVKRSLQLAAASLAEGHPIPEKAKELIAKPLVPFWLYRWLGHWGWKRKAKRYGVERELMAQPFKQDY